LPCSPGAANDVPGSKNCALCEEKYFSNVTELVTCHKCPIGKRSIRRGSASCINCIAGRYGKTCEKCKIGWYRAADNEDASICTSCVPGRYQSELGQAACLPCVPGRSNPTFAAATCPNCADGQYTFATLSIECKTCQLGRGTIRNGSAFCTPCAKGKHASVNSSGVCTNCQINQYQDKEEQSFCKNCPSGFMANSGSFECLRPEKADPANLPVPSPPILTTIVGDGTSIKIEWEHQHGTELQVDGVTKKIVIPDGFNVRLGSSRDFDDEKILPSLVGGNLREMIITMEDNIWMLEKPIFIQVAAYILGNVQKKTNTIESEWSTATEPWELAVQCKDDEYLDTNSTKPGTCGFLFLFFFLFFFFFSD